MSAAIVLGAMMSILDTTIVNVAIPTLGRQFHTTLATIQWVNTGYALSLAVVIPLTRWVMDKFGTKKAWLVCVALFITGSVLCGSAWSLVTLIICRVLQGFGGGMILPIGQTILSRAAGPARMGRVMTVVGIPSSIGPLLGPTLGGLILLRFSWHWIFYVNVPIGLLALLLGLKYLAPDEGKPSEPFDFTGLFLLPVGLALIIYGVAEIGNTGTFSTSVEFGIGAGVVLLCAFVVHALRARHPMVDIRLWKNPGFAVSNLTVFLLGCGLQGALLILALYFQIGRGFSPLKSGLLQSPTALTTMCFLPIAGIVVDRIGARRIVPFGIIVSTMSLVIWAHVGPATSLVLLDFGLVLRGVGLGTTITPATASGYSHLPAGQLGAASTLTNITSRLSGAIGVAVMSVVLQRQIASALPGHSLSLSSIPPPGPARTLIQPAITHAFGNTFWVAAFLCIAAFLPALFLRRLPPSEVNPRPQPGAPAPEVKRI